MATDRRALLTGLAGLPVAAVALPAVAAPAAAPSADDLALIDMHRRFLDHMAEARRFSTAAEEATDDDCQACDDAMDEALGLMDGSADLRPTTLPGALAALAWARWEFGRHYVEEYDAPTGPDGADRWTLAMLDGALGVLRQAVEGGRA